MPVIVTRRNYPRPILEAVDALEGKKPAPRQRKEAEPAPRKAAARKTTTKRKGK